MSEGYEIEWKSKSILTKENFTIIYYFRDPIRYINLIGNDFYLQNLDYLRDLKNRGVDIHNLSYRQDLKSRGIDINKLLSHNLDYLCERQGKYFIIDVKSKHISNDRTKNYFYVTRNEIDVFSYYENNENIMIKILVVLKQGESLLYRFFNWNDFILPKGFLSGKYKNTVRVKLKKNIDLSEFKKVDIGVNKADKPLVWKKWSISKK